jgi:hypothetical protein
MKPTSFLWANAYHEAGHAIAGWALDLCVLEIRIRDDRPGEHAKFCGAERLSLVHRIALLNAGRQAEELFGHRLPSWATDRDRENTLNAIAAEGIKETAEMKQWIDKAKNALENFWRSTITRSTDCNLITSTAWSSSTPRGTGTRPWSRRRPNSRTTAARRTTNSSRRIRK